MSRRCAQKHKFSEEAQSFGKGSKNVLLVRTNPGRSSETFSLRHLRRVSSSAQLVRTQRTFETLRLSTPRLPPKFREIFTLLAQRMSKNSWTLDFLSRGLVQSFLKVRNSCACWSKCLTGAHKEQFPRLDTFRPGSCRVPLAMQNHAQSSQKCLINAHTQSFNSMSWCGHTFIFAPASMTPRKVSSLAPRFECCPSLLSQTVRQLTSALVLLTFHGFRAVFVQGRALKSLRLGAATPPVPPHLAMGEVQYQFPCSFLGSLLLHENRQDSAGDLASGSLYNDFYFASVNARSHIQPLKVIPHSTEAEQNENLLWQATGVTDTEQSPLRGTYHCVLTSFEEGRPEEGGVPLHLAWPRHPSQPGQELHAVPANLKKVKHAVRWLTKNEASADSLPEAVQCLVAALRTLPFDSAQPQRLKKFIQEREWTGQLWGGERDYFLQRVGVLEGQDQWLACRRYISFNTAWQLRLLVLPYEGLHRCFTVVTALLGIPPPGENPELDTRVKDFGQDLRVVGGWLSRRLRAAPERRVRLDTGTVLYLRTPEVVDTRLAFSLVQRSAQLQQGTGRQTDHGMHQMLGSLIRFFPTILQGSPFTRSMFLLRPDGTGRGLDGLTRRVWNDEDPYPTRDQFLELLVEDGLCENVHEAGERLAVVVPRAGSWPAGIRGASGPVDWYIQLWIRAFVKALHSALRLTFTTDEHGNQDGILSSDPEVKLAECSGMTLEEFGRIWQRNGKNGPLAGDSEPFRLDPEGSPGVPHAVGWLRERRGEVADPITTDNLWKRNRRRLPTTGGREKIEKFPDLMLDFLWIFFFAHLSPECRDAVLEFADGRPDLGAFPQTNGSRTFRNNSRKSFRCLVMTISASASGSMGFWKHSFFTRHKRDASQRVTHWGELGQSLHARISAVKHSCKFFARAGLAPSLPPRTEKEDEILQNFDPNSPHQSRLREDFLALYTVAFIDQVHAHDEARRGEAAYWKHKLDRKQEGNDDTPQQVSYLTAKVEFSINWDWGLGAPGGGVAGSG